MIDMHIHSTYSDGTYSVKEILEKAEQLNLKYISITDHDNCRAYNELKNIDISKYYSGKVIPGIEIKCIHKGHSMDLLGYNFDINKMNNWIDKFYKDKKRKDLQLKYFDLLYDACERLSLKITPKEEIKWNPENDWASFTIYNDLKKYCENKEKLPEDLWEDFGTFSKKYCANFNSPFYINKTNDYPSLDIGIKAIKDCGGIAIMAHIFIYRWAENKELLIKDIKENYDIDGFECYHSNFSEDNIKYMLNYCNENNLLMSGGSDCHGANKPGIELAFGKGNLNIDEKIIEKWVKES